MRLTHKHLTDGQFQEVVSKCLELEEKVKGRGVVGVTALSEYNNNPAHEERLWPSIEDLGILVDCMPLLPSMGQSLLDRVENSIKRQQVAIMKQLNAAPKQLRHPDMLVTYGALSNLLAVGVGEYYLDIMIYIESCTIKNNQFLVTNDNRFFQNIVKFPLILGILREEARHAIEAYNKKHQTDFSYDICCVPVIPLTNFVNEFPVFYLQRKDRYR